MDQFFTRYDLSRSAQECSEHLKRLFLKADTQSLFSEFRPVEIDFENGKPVRAGDQFGLGRMTTGGKK